jgi:hypothetical protein
VEYLVQSAHITDIDRLAALNGRTHRDGRDGGRWDPADKVRPWDHEGRFGPATRRRGHAGRELTVANKRPQMERAVTAVGAAARRAR